VNPQLDLYRRPIVAHQHEGSGCSILALAPQEWDGQWVNRQQLLSRIGRHHRVLYSTGGWFVWDRHSDAWRQSSIRGCIGARDNVWVDEPPRYLMRWPRITAWDKAVMRLQALRWKTWIKEQNHRPFISQICHPKFFPYVDMLKPDRLVYHVYDRYDRMPGWTQKWEYYERELLKQAHLVFCASDAMAAALREKVPRNVRILPNAADSEAFSAASTDGAAEPPDLAQIPHPRIGWIGSLHPQVDYALVKVLALRNPSWHFVFVGHKVSFPDSRDEQQYAECRELSNVHFLGYKHYRVVPSYAVNMDVNMMCYRVSDRTWIEANSPLKLHEYLAAGLPVVSADLPAVQPFRHVVRIARGIHDWKTAIQEALTTGGSGTAAERMAVAAANSWDARAGELTGWLQSLVRQ